MTMKKRNRVLAIDDEPAMIEWLKILLEHEGYEVRTAMIGTRGEEIFKTWKPDVVVTDMMLPDIDGLELLRRFKQAHADTEVIVVTGHQADLVEQALAGLNVKFVRNPDFAGGLASSVKGACRPDDTSAAAVAPPPLAARSRLP